MLIFSSFSFVIGHILKHSKYNPAKDNLNYLYNLLKKTLDKIKFTNVLC